MDACSPSAVHSVERDQDNTGAELGTAVAHDLIRNAPEVCRLIS